MSDTIDWKRRALAAEKTVDVLKVRVRGLYNGTGRSSIANQLDKARERDARNRQRRELMEVRAAELQKHSDRLEDEVAARTRQVQTILDNVTFGFLVIDRELVVQPGFTRSCEALFGAPVETGNDLADLLRVQGQGPHTNLLLGVDQVFEDMMPEELTLSQMPQRFEVGDRILRVEGRTIRDADDGIEALLLTVSDISALEVAQRRSATNETLIGILNQKTAFHAFLVDCKLRLQGSREANGDEVFIRRAVHTIKGNSASYGLDDVASVVHRLEGEAVIDEAALDTIEAALVSFLERHKAVLHLDWAQLEVTSYEVTNRDMGRLRELLNSGGEQSSSIQRWTAEVVQRPAGELIGPVEAFVERLAERLEKEVGFTFTGGDVCVDAELMRPIFSNLSHLLRNALDHGIEPPWDRGDKDRRATLCVEVVDVGDAFEVRVADDGRGIDGDAVFNKAVERGVISADAQLDRAQRHALIFEDGLSTAEVATSVSGRGVGMSAIKATLESCGGRVEIDTELGRGTKFTLHVPKPEILQAVA